MHVDRYTCLMAMVVPLVLFIWYWIIRLAVRGGIEDADRRRQKRVIDEQMWKSIQERRTE